MDATYRSEYGTLYAYHWWWRVREEALLEVIEDECPRKGQCKILDVGCGDGWFFPKLRRFGEVEGVDPHVSAQCGESAGVYSCQFDDRFQPGKHYDLILMLDVLEHLSNPTSALQRALSLLARDGKLIVTVPAFNIVWTHHDRINGHLTRYTKSRLGALARSAGLQVKSVRYWFMWTFPVKLAMRMLEGLGVRKRKQPRVPSQYVNNALYAFSRFERALLWRRGAPFGTTLVAVGVRGPLLNPIAGAVEVS